MLSMDKKDDDAMMIAKIVKEEADNKTANPAIEAKKAAVRKMMDALKSDDADTFMTAMDEFKIIGSDNDNFSDD